MIDAYIIGVPDPTPEEVEDLFRFHLPPDESGYIRPVTAEEVECDTLPSTHFGFFTADGELDFYGQDLDGVLASATEDGFTVYRVN